MCDEKNLALRQVRLRIADQWANKGGGITFVFSHAGVGAYVSEANTHRIASGDIMVLNGGSNGRLSAGDKGDFLFQTFTLSIEHLYPLFESNEISVLKQVIDNFKSVKIYAGNSALALDCQKLLTHVNPQPDLEHRGQLLKIATAILAIEFKLAQSRHPGFGGLVDHVLQTFEKLSSDELRTLPVAELAQRFNCSRRHLNRLFQDHFGVSVAAMKMEMRLLKAVSLLRDAELKVINVAEQCGFNHLGLFNTCFKRRFGASPGVWRKSEMERGSAATGLIAGANGCPLQSKGICPWTGRPADPSGKNIAVSAIAGPPESLLIPFPSPTHKNVRSRHFHMEAH